MVSTLELKHTLSRTPFQHRDNCDKDEDGKLKWEGWSQKDKGKDGLNNEFKKQSDGFRCVN